MSGKLEPTNSPYAMAILTAIEIGNSMKPTFSKKVVKYLESNL